MGNERGSASQASQLHNVCVLGPGGPTGNWRGGPEGTWSQAPASLSPVPTD